MAEVIYLPPDLAIIPLEASKLASILERITYLDWRFVISVNQSVGFGTRTSLGVHFSSRDVVTGHPTALNFIGCVPIPPMFASDDLHDIEQWAIMLAYQAIRNAVLHEMDEWFRYDNRPVYNPHDPAPKPNLLAAPSPLPPLVYFFP